MKTLRTFIMDYETMRGKHFAYEVGDCTVRAIAVLMEVSYAAAHAIMHLSGRNDATRWAGKFHRAMTKTGGKSVVPYKKFTVEQFVAQHPEGRYLVWHHGHAFAVIDGVCFDTVEVRPRHKVMYAWQFNDKII